MDNETEILAILKEAAAAGFLNASQAQKGYFHPYVNTALEIIKYLNGEKEGSPIESVSYQIDKSYNTTGIYLKCLCRLIVISYNENIKEGGEAPKKYYYLIIRKAS